MNLRNFLWHAKRGHGQCIIAMQQADYIKYRNVVKRIFLNNYAFLADDEYRSSYACELIGFYNNDAYFLKVLWDKIKRTTLEDYYTFSYLIDNLYFLLKRSSNHFYDSRIKMLLIRKISKDNFSFNENKSLCSLLSTIIDLKINVPITEIVNHHFDEYKDSNLDLSSVEFAYRIYLTNRSNHPILLDNQVYQDNDALFDCVSNNDYFNKQLPFIANNISNRKIVFLLSCLKNNQVSNIIKINILKVVFFSQNREEKNIKFLLALINQSSEEQKKIIFNILIECNPRQIDELMTKEIFDDCFYIRLLLKKYDLSNYQIIHRKILKLKIDYSDSSGWFDVENDLIKYFSKKNPDTRLLKDLKFFYRNGLSSTSRYKTAMVLKRYNMLNDKDVRALRFDANYLIRKKFKKSV